MGLTKKQMDVYRFIGQYTDDNGIAPTQREIKEHFGLKSYGSVQRYLNYLMDANLLERDLNARRGIALRQDSSEGDDSAQVVCDLPLLGMVAAGNPIEAMEFMKDRLRSSKSNEEFLVSMNG